ncbi:MAG: GNAT family N-acetyltransferase [Bacteroidota bacterium]
MPSFHFLSSEDLVSFHQLIQLFQQVFDEPANGELTDDFLSQRLSDPRFIVLVARQDGQIIGGATAYELPLYTHRQSEWLIYDVAVHQDFQRRGIGKELLQHLQLEAQKRGVSDLFLDAHAEDLHAIAFYRRLGAKEERVHQFIFSS